MKLHKANRKTGAHRRISNVITAASATPRRWHRPCALKSIMLFGAGCALCCAAVASPKVTDVRLSQDGHRRLHIDYALDADAVVTFDVMTNGVSIGRDLLETFTGNFGVVEAGARRISWDTRANWPDQICTNMTATVKAWSPDAPPDYMIVDLVHSNVNWYASEAEIPGGTVLRDEYKTTKLVLRRIHARGIPWRMGRKLTEATDGFNNYQHPHEVVLTNDYYIGVFELTQKQYKIIQGLADSAAGPFVFWGNDKNPAENIPSTAVNGGVYVRGSPLDYNFVKKGHAVHPSSLLGRLRKIGGGLYFDLPTSAQWEYACRAETGTAFNNGCDDYCSDVAWYSGNWRDDPAVSSNMTHEVGLKTPNAWGLYDMHGNVWEWCVDKATTAAEWYQSLEEPTGPAVTGSNDTVFRSGGCYNHSLALARSSSRIDKVNWQAESRVGLRVWCACPSFKMEEE